MYDGDTDPAHHPVLAQQRGRRETRLGPEVKDGHGMALGYDEARMRPVRPGRDRGDAHQVVRPPHRRSQHESILMGGQFEVLGQVDAERLGHAPYRLFQDLSFVRPVGRQAAQPADRRLMQRLVLYLEVRSGHRRTTAPRSCRQRSSMVHRSQDRPGDDRTEVWFLRYRLAMPCGTGRLTA